MTILDFNKRIAKKRLAYLQNTDNRKLSLQDLQEKIRNDVDSMGSAFPNYLKEKFEKVFSKIADYQKERVAKGLDPNYDEPIGANPTEDTVPDSNIIFLKEYIKDDK